MTEKFSDAIAIRTPTDEGLIFCRRWEDIVVLNLTYRNNGDTSLPLDHTEVLKLIQILEAASDPQSCSVQLAPENRANTRERTVLTITRGAKVGLSFKTDDDRPISIDLSDRETCQLVELLRRTLLEK